jgi:Ca2+:H+ antiporter
MRTTPPNPAAEHSIDGYTDRVLSAARKNSVPLRGRDSDDMNGTNAQTPLLGGPLRGLAGGRYGSYPILHVVKTVICSNYVNVMLVFLPLGIISGVLGWAAPLTFGFNFLAIMAMASLLSFATEEFSKTVGQTIGGLLNASFGNATELIVSIVALKEGQIKLVQASMLGSILSNLLLVLSLLVMVDLE